MVESTTRAPQSISHIPENISVITADQIKELNAHSIAEVLNRATGILVDFNNNDFSPFGTISIHGSHYEQVLVLIDGRRYNKVAANINYTDAIPVQIVERIEIIRGAASSTWGSAQGGIINIITKEAAPYVAASGIVSGSYGENSSSDSRAEVSGTLGRLGYYLYAGRQESDGILKGHTLDHNSLFSKLTTRIGESNFLNVSLAYSQPEATLIYFEDWDWRETKDEEELFFAAELQGLLADGLSYSVAYSNIDNEFQTHGGGIANGHTFYDFLFDTRSEEINTQLLWSREKHTMVLGLDYLRAEETDHDQLAGVTLPTSFEENWAVYFNDTIYLDKFTIIPGIRYDNQSIADEILSPSLGMTYRFNRDTLARAQVARGFSKPAMNLKSENYGYYGVNANPDLQQEIIWTYQAGLETTAINWLYCKATLFQHDTTDTWEFDEEQNHWQNSDSGISRRGIELEAQTAYWHNLNLITNFTYILKDPEEGETDEQYYGNVTLRYNDDTITALLSGHYLWFFKENYVEGVEHQNGKFIWDFTVTSSLGRYENFHPRLFASVHNLFNGSLYPVEYTPTAQRWVEVGLWLSF